MHFAGRVSAADDDHQTLAPAQEDAVAERLAARQRPIAVSEFFLKNRHLLGFDSPHRALLTAVKEAVDNSLDAAEEARILPDIRVEISERSHGALCVSVEDNGPGIVPEQVAQVFGRLLYGSKFHKLAQSRGTQGIGISAAGMYAELTTGKPLRVRSKTAGSSLASELVLSIDTAKNRPDLHRKQRVAWAVPHGTRVEFELEAHYRSGPHSVQSYLGQTAIANPHARLTLVAPDGSVQSWERGTEELPRAALEIKAHPHGVELGQLIQLLRDTKCSTLHRFLCEEFSEVGPSTAHAIIERAGTRLTERSRPARIAHGPAANLHRAIAATKIRRPSTDCLVPIGEEQLLAGLRKEIAADFYCAVTRPAAVYRGNPFVVEVAAAFGKPGGVGLELMPSGQIARRRAPELDTARVPDAGEPVLLLRYANRAPLLFQQGACAITRAGTDTHWQSYGLEQPRGALPVGPLCLLVHVASVWVPFTSEAKEAIAPYPEIARELHLALRDCGRKLYAYAGRGAKLKREFEKRAHIRKYLPHVGLALQSMLELGDAERDATVRRLEDLLERRRHV